MLIHTDAMSYLLSGVGKQRCGFADIPDNIGIPYEGYMDRQDPSEYRFWVRKLLVAAMDRFDIFWLSYNAIHELWVKELLNHVIPKGWRYRGIIWYFEFGQYRDTGLTNCYRPIALMHAPGVQLNYDSIRIVSTRMMMGDKRAVGPKVPGDVWEFPRIQGNNSERRSWHPTQHPEALMERIVLMSMTQWKAGRTEVIPQATMTDLCLGSGTTGLVCNRLQVPWIGVEPSFIYIERLRELFTRYLGKKV